MDARFAEACRRARPWLERRWIWALLLLACALAYYGSYFRYSFNLRDEGGTVTLVAKRMLDGERPFLDVTLGYNVGWFYPIVGLFKLCGVNFVLLRAYCFALSTLTALLAFFTLERASRRPWVAFLVALLPVFVPGMTFKNYMPLLAVGNAFCLMQLALGPRGRRARDGFQLPTEDDAPRISWLRIVLGGVALGLTFLIRIDVGYFFIPLWLGTLWLKAGERGLRFGQRLALSLGGPVVILALAAALQLPAYADAHRRGFAEELHEQYIGWPSRLLEAGVAHLVQALPSSMHPAPPNSSGVATLPVAPAEKEASWDTENLPRPALSQAWQGKNLELRLFALLLYAPFLSLVPLILWALAATSIRLRRGEVERPLAALVLLGSALTTFPQYFFFRPDAPHLSEFSPGFWVAAFGAAFLLGSSPRGAGDRRRLAGGFFVFLLILHAGVYLWRMLPDRYAGTIWARKARPVLFHGENGVDVFVSKKEAEGFRAILKLVRQHSTPADYLVAYPYHPALNILCDRRTYEHNVYVDNATREVGWSEEAIKRFQQFRPAVIILSDWAINGTEASRFSNWALPAKTWIEANYLNQGGVLEFEIFTRSEREE